MTATAVGQVGAPSSASGPVGGATRRLRRALPGLGVLLVCLVLTSITGLLPVWVTHVDSDSMAPTLADGDAVLVERWAGPAHRGDVVAVHDPVGEGLLTKRAVAVEGDAVELSDGVLLVNGEEVCVPSVDPARLDGVWFGPVTVPAGELFLLGDNRGRSIDSRHFGSVATSEVIGLVRTRLWPAPGGVAREGC